MELNQQEKYRRRGSLRELIASNLLPRIQHGIVFLVGTCLLCLPAFYNGYPFVFSDLIGYAADGMAIVRRHWPGGGHPPFYGVAIWPLHLETSLWPIVIVQGLIMCHLLSTVLRAIGVVLRWPAFLALIAGLAIFTSLPWYVSHVMPDVFAGVLILSLFLLAFCTARLTRAEKVYFCFLSIFSLVVHLSFIPISIGILMLAIGFRLLRRQGRAVPRPVFALVPILLALGLSSYVSHRFWGNFSGPPYAPPYLLAHVLVDGPGKEFLQRVCGQQKYVLCGYQDSIPDNVEEFMFRDYSPYKASGREPQVRAEAKSIVIGTAKMFPLETIEAAIREGIAQVITFNTEVAQLDDIPDEKGGSLADSFDEKLPFIGRGYQHTKQQRGLLSPARLLWMNDFHRMIVIVSALFSLYAAARCIRRRDWINVQFLAVVWTSLLINGLITGMAVGVFGRFGARVIWLLPFAASAVALSRWYAPRRTSSRVPSV